MHVKIALCCAVAGTLAAAMVAPSAGAMSPRGAHPADTITQTYKCTTPVGNITEDIQVSGSVSLSKGHLKLSKVVFTFANNFGTDVTINKIRFVVPDPNQDSAPYQAGTAAVSGSPAGWTAGHKSSGIFEYFAGTQDLADGASLAVPKLSATYQDLGPKGTVIGWKPGTFSFNVKSPDAGEISCTPKAPIQTFASITE